MVNSVYSYYYSEKIWSEIKFKTVKTSTAALEATLE